MGCYKLPRYSSEIINIFKYNFKLKKMKKLITSILSAILLFISAKSFAQDLESRGDNDKCGYVKKGAKKGFMGWKFVIKPDFTCSSKNFDPETNLAVAESSANQKWGVINKNGEVAIPLEYQEGTDISNGKIIAKKDGKWGILDTAGKVLLPFEYDYMNAEQTEKTKILLVRKGEKPNSKYGFVDFNGKILVPIEYEIIKFVPISISNGSRHYNLKKDGKFGLYGLDEGKFLTEVKYDAELWFTSLQKPAVYKGSMDGDDYEISETGAEKYLGEGKPKSNSASNKSSTSSSAKKSDSKKDMAAKSSTFKCVKCTTTETKTGGGSPSGGTCPAHVKGSGGSTSHTWKKI